jgi:hypothetical protein
VFVWKLSGEQGHDDVEFITEIGKQQLKTCASGLNIGHVTSLNWYDENVLALSTTSGTLMFNDLREKQGEGDNSICKPSKFIWRTEGGPIWDTALWRDPSGIKIITAEDSGDVSVIDPRRATPAEAIKLTVRLKNCFVSHF